MSNFLSLFNVNIQFNLIKQSNLAADECKFNLVRYVMLDKHEARSISNELKEDMMQNVQ